MILNPPNTIISPKPRIIFDGTVFCKNLSGERYSAEGIIRVLFEHCDVCVFVPNEFSSTVETLATHFGISREQIFVLPFRSRTLLIMKLLGFKIGGPSNVENDYIWNPSHRIFPNVVNQFCVVHDMMPVTAAKYIPIFDRLLFRTSLWRIRRLNCHVFCHSRYVRNELIEFGGISAKKITVVPLGLPPDAGQKKDRRKTVHAFRDVELLYVSAYQERKNFELLIDYVKQFNIDAEIKIRLTIAGPGLQERFGATDDSQIRILGYITEEAKRCLLGEADIYINPSAAEGFGITNLEAQLFGLPVLCSDIPAFREVLGDSAAYFQWHDYLSFRNELLKLLRDHEYIARLVKRGRLNASQSIYENKLLEILLPKVLSIINSSATLNSGQKS